MRIVCDKCSAAYAVPDRLIGSRGVRAQCPKCKNLQTVKRDPNAAPAEMPAPAAAAAPTPVAAKQPPAPIPPKATSSALVSPAIAPLPSAPPVAVLEDFDPFAELAPVAPAAPPKGADTTRAPGPPAPKAPERNLLGAEDPFAGISFEEPARGAPSRTAASPAAPSDDPFTLMELDTKDAGHVPSSVGGDPISDLFGATAPPPPATTSQCAECGASLDDAFDAALGVCDTCRAKQNSAAEGQPSSTIEVDPSLVDELETIPSKPADGGRGRKIKRPPPAAPVKNSVAMSATSPGSSRVKWVIGGALTLAIGALAAGAAVTRTNERKAAEAARAAAAVPSIPAPLETALRKWRPSQGEASLSGVEWRSEGLKALAEDRDSAYRRAEVSFKRALLREPGDLEALVGYVQAVALGRGPELDDVEFAEALVLADLALAQSGRAKRSLVAKAWLLLARADVAGYTEQARSLAEEALRGEEETARGPALLVLGRAQLQNATSSALENIDAALKVDPSLGRAHYYRAQALVVTGELAKAVGEFQVRLSATPEHDQAARELGRLLVEVGDIAQARELFTSRVQKLPDSEEAKLALAWFQIQVRGEQPALAAKTLRTLTKDPNDLSESRWRFLLALAAAERVMGKSAEARKTLDAAKGLRPEDPAIRLQSLLLAIDAPDGGQEAVKLAEQLQGALGDPALEKTLLGRARVAAADFSRAHDAFREAHAEDGRRLDALLWAGVSAVEAGQRDLGYRLLYQALLADPSELAPERLLTPLRVTGAELLRGIEGRLMEGSAKGDVTATLYEGVLRYHLGELSQSERLLAQVLEQDTLNTGAFVYRSLAASARRDARSALRYAEAGLRNGRQLANAHFASGVAAALGNKAVVAEKAFRETLSLQPGHLGAAIALAQLEHERHPGDARARLLKALGQDPSRKHARRLLHAIDRMAAR